MSLPKWSRIVRDAVAFTARPHADARIRNPGDVVTLLKPQLAAEDVEVFVVVTLNKRNDVLSCWEVSRGTLDATLVHSREVFRPAIADAAAGIILVHNHPTGDPTPSAEDRTITHTLCKAGVLLDIPVFDHVIIAGEQYSSFAALGLLP